MKTIEVTIDNIHCVSLLIPSTVSHASGRMKIDENAHIEVERLNTLMII